MKTWTLARTPYFLWEEGMGRGSGEDTDASFSRLHARASTMLHSLLRVAFGIRAEVQLVSCV